MVKKAFFGGALILTNMDGEELPSPVNSDALSDTKLEVWGNREDHCMFFYF